MPRKKKTDNNAKVYSLLEKQIVNTPVTKTSGKWVSYGRRNDYPNSILNLYASSPTLDACISFCVSALIGNGLKLDEIDTQPNDMYDWNEMVRRLATDWFLYGSFSFQVIKNRGGETYSFYHQPIDTVRCSERDEHGKINTWWLCQDWTATGKYPPVEIKAFNMLDDEKIKYGEPYLYVYESYSPMTTYYWVPIWSSAMKAVQAECEFLNYDLSTATNSFIPSGVLSLPPSADDAERKAIVEEVKRTFVGTNNSSRLMVSFRNDSEDKPVTFEKFDLDNATDYFQNSNERAISRILAAFNIPSRLLIGYPEQNAGFSSEGALLETAYNVYNLIAGRHYRNIILNTINHLFLMNGIETTLEVEDIYTTNNNEVEQDVEETIVVDEKDETVR